MCAGMYQYQCESGAHGGVFVGMHAVYMRFCLYCCKKLTLKIHTNTMVAVLLLDRGRALRLAVGRGRALRIVAVQHVVRCVAGSAQAARAAGSLGRVRGRVRLSG